MISKQDSLLDNNVLIEYLPIERIQAIIRSDKLAVEWTKPNYVQKFAARNYDNEIKQLEAYLNGFNKKYGGYLCTYRKPGHGWGRVHPKKSLGLTCMGFMVRNTLIQGLYYDFDLKNAQVEIIRNICMENNISCPMVQQYCSQRDKILEDLSQEYKVSKSIAKKLILRLCFFGTFCGWCAEQNINAKEGIWISNFVRELKEIANEFKKSNQKLYETARKTKQAKNEKNFIGSFFALYLQEQELRIVESIISWLQCNTNIMKHPSVRTSYHVGIYEYDGIKLLKQNVDKYGKEKLRQDLIQKTKELTGFDLQWVEKPIEEFHDISKELELVKNEAVEDDKLKKLQLEITSKFDDVGVIEAIQEIFPNHYVFCKGKWFGWDGSKWKSNQRPLEKAIMYELPKHWKGLIQPFLDKYQGKGCANSKIIEDLHVRVEDFIKNHLRSNFKINGCIGRARILLANDTLDFDGNPYLIGFDNCIFDLQKEMFRTPKFDDYVTMSCGFNVHAVLPGLKEEIDGQTVVCENISPEDGVKYSEIQTILKQILPHVAVRKLVLMIYASGILGLPIEKFFVFNGKGRNGKGLLDESIEYAYGDYACWVDSKILTESSRFSKSGSANPAKAKIHRKRMVFCQEPGKNDRINNDFLKEITGGGEICARMLHSSETSVDLHLTLVMECNDKPLLKDEPTRADAERITDILFPSFFTDDKTLHDPNKHIYPKVVKYKTKQWRDSIRVVFMNMIIRHLIELKKNDFLIEKFVPECVKDRSQQYLQESLNVHQIFQIYFEIKQEGKQYYNDQDYTLANIVRIIRSSEYFRMLTKKMQRSKELQASSMKEFFKNNIVYKKHYYFDKSLNQHYLKDFRLIADGHDVSPVEKPEAKPEAVEVETVESEYRLT